MQWGRRRAFAFLPVKWNENSGEKEENGQRAALLQEPKGAILRMGHTGTQQMPLLLPWCQNEHKQTTVPGDAGTGGKHLLQALRRDMPRGWQ